MISDATLMHFAALVVGGQPYAEHDEYDTGTVDFRALSSLRDLRFYFFGLTIYLYTISMKSRQKCQYIWRILAAMPA